MFKIDSDTSLVASTGTSCEGQPPRKKKKLSASSSSLSPSSSSSSAIVSSINIAGNNTTSASNENEQKVNIGAENLCSSDGDTQVIDKMQEQGNLNSNGK